MAFQGPPRAYRGSEILAWDVCGETSIQLPEALRLPTREREKCLEIGKAHTTRSDARHVRCFLDNRLGRSSETPNHQASPVLRDGGHGTGIRTLYFVQHKHLHTSTSFSVPEHRYTVPHRLLCTPSGERARRDAVPTQPLCFLGTQQRTLSSHPVTVELFIARHKLPVVLGSTE